MAVCLLETEQVEWVGGGAGDIAYIKAHFVYINTHVDITIVWCIYVCIDVYMYVCMYEVCVSRPLAWRFFFIFSSSDLQIIYYADYHGHVLHVVTMDTHLVRNFCLSVFPLCLVLNTTIIIVITTTSTSIIVVSIAINHTCFPLLLLPPLPTHCILSAASSFSFSFVFASLHSGYHNGIP